MPQTVAVAVTLLFSVIFVCVEDGLALEEGKDYWCKQCEAGRYRSPCVNGRRQEPRVVDCVCIIAKNTPTFMACNNGLQSTDAGADSTLKALPNLCCPHPKCKETDPTDSINCYIENDLALLVDSSEEKEEFKWPLLINVTKKFLDGWIRYGHPKSRMSWVVFSLENYVAWDLEFSRTHIIEKMERIITEAKRLLAVTYSPDAMMNAFQNVFQKSVKKDIKGLRKTMVIITDSQIVESRHHEAEKTSAEIGGAGILPYVIGISRSHYGWIQEEDLRVMAGPTGKDRRYMIDSYGSLEASMRKITADICYKIKLRQ